MFWAQPITVVKEEVVTENALRHDWNREASVARHPEQDLLATAPAASGSGGEFVPIQGCLLAAACGGGYLPHTHLTGL